jgi:flagellin
VTVANYSLYTATQTGFLDKVSGTASIDTISISALTDSAADQTTLDGFIAQVTGALNTVSQSAADLGAIKNRISNNTEFVKSLMDSVDRGIGQLVDADMNAESTRLQALQTQQQLGVQALSIANQNSQSILSLFK